MLELREDKLNDIFWCETKNANHGNLYWHKFSHSDEKNFTCESHDVTCQYLFASRDGFPDPSLGIGLMMRECLYSTKTWEVLGNPSPPPSRFPSTFNLSGARDGFPNTSRVLVEHMYTVAATLVEQIKLEMENVKSHMIFTVT